MLRGFFRWILYEFLWEPLKTSHIDPAYIIDPAGARQAYRLVSGEFLPGLGPGQAGFYGGSSPLVF